MKTKLINLLRELCSVPGISGQEYIVGRKIKELLLELGADVKADKMGNVYTRIKGRGNAPSLMFVAHMDQVGAIISEITQTGLLMYKTVGCVDKASLPATRVLVDGIPGAVSAPPAHMASSLDNVLSYIDVGAECKEDVHAMGIDVGSQVSFDTQFTSLGKNRICSHSIDDRIGCAILIILYEYLKASAPEGDVVLAFSVREEATMAGAAMLVDKCAPDWVIAVDTVPMKMNPYGSSVIDLGRGPVFQLAEGVMSSFSGNFIHPGIKKLLISCAEKLDIPYQLCAEYGDWTTDGNTINRANCGTACGYISIPRRNAHSASEIMDMRDAVNAVELMFSLVSHMAEISLDYV